MKTPHWGRDAQVLSSCVRNTGASRHRLPPLSGPHSARKTLCSRLLLRVPSSLILPCWNFISGTVSQLCGARVSSNPGCALGAVGYLGAGDVVMRIRWPEENIINHQYESGHRHAEEIDDRHRHFHPNLCWHVGVFGPQLPGIARPPLHITVQLLGGRGDLSASRFHVGRLLKGTTLANDVSPDSCLFIRVRTAEPAALLSHARLFSGLELAQVGAWATDEVFAQVFWTRVWRRSIPWPPWEAGAYGEIWTQGGCPWYQLDGTAVKITLLKPIVSRTTLQNEPYVKASSLMW